MTVLHDSPRVLTACRIEGCGRPVKVLARQLCAGCYNRELRNGRLEPIEANALTGGRWVNVRGVMRWAPSPQAVDERGVEAVRFCSLPQGDQVR